MILLDDSLDESHAHHRAPLPRPRAGRRPSTDKGEAAGEAGWEGAHHLAGNVRRLREPGGNDLGGYRYSAFGDTLEDTVRQGGSLASIDNRKQPLRWKGMWRFDLGGGVEVYDARARMWSPKLGTFLSVDEFAFHDPTTTLWGWPGQNPARRRDPFGRGDDNPLAVGLIAAGGALIFGGLFQDDTRSSRRRPSTRRSRSVSSSRCIR